MGINVNFVGQKEVLRLKKTCKFKEVMLDKEILSILNDCFIVCASDTPGGCDDVLVGVVMIGSSLSFVSWDYNGEPLMRIDYGNEDYPELDKFLEKLLDRLNILSGGKGIKEVYWHCQRNADIMWLYLNPDGEISVVL